MTQAVIYARASSKEQAAEGYSIDAQLKLLREYAATQGLKVAEEFVEVETAKRTFAYAGLVRRAHCGCSITAEEKKGRYVYYHCTGGRGPCDRRHIREEALEGKLGELVRVVVILPEVVERIVSALRESHKDEREFHETAVARLQAEVAKIQARLDAMYEDKLDGTITEDLWRRKNEEWGKRQMEALAAVERHQNAPPTTSTLTREPGYSTWPAVPSSCGRSSPKRANGSCWERYYRAAPSTARTSTLPTESPSAGW